MSGNQFKTHPSLLHEIKMLVKGNEDLSAIMSDVLAKRRILANSLRPVGTSSSTERPMQIMMTSSTESCDAVTTDELSMSPASVIENVTARLSKVVLSDVEGSPFSNSHGKNVKQRAYEDSADDEASSDDSCDSLSSWLTIDSSDGDSKYPSTLDDDYEDSSFDESNEYGSVYEESLRSKSPGGLKDRNGNYVSADECDWKSKHYSSTTESNSEIEALMCENKNASSDDSRESVEKSSDSSKTVDSRNEETKDCSSAESNGEIKAKEGENKSDSSDDSSESDEKSSDSLKTVDSCNEETKDCSSAESNGEIEAREGENKSNNLDDSSESDEKSLYSSETVDSCDEESKNYSSPTESYSEIESENKSASLDDSSESDEKSSDGSKTVDSCDESNQYSSPTESNSEIDELDGEETSSDDSSESDRKSSDSSTREKWAKEEAQGERAVDSSEESHTDADESSESFTSESEPSLDDLESNSRGSSSCEDNIAKSDSDSTDSSTSVSSESSDSCKARKSDESGQSSNSESGDRVWIEPRRRLSSDLGDSSLIQSDDSLVCLKAGIDKIIISKRNRIGEIQAIYFFPDLQWRESSKTESTTEESATQEALSSSEDPEPAFPGVAEKSKLVKNLHRQHKRCKHRMVDQLKERESTSSDVNLLESVLTGAMYDAISTSSSDESKGNTDMSPSYKKYSSISEDSSPSNEIHHGQSGPQSHSSNTYRKFKDVDELM